MGAFVPMIACLGAALMIWGILRVGAKRPTAGWAWMLVLLFAIVLIVDIISSLIPGTNAKATISTVPEQKAKGK